MVNGNFCWMATWKITDRCNLSCAYCDPAIMKRAGASEEVDRFGALARIASCNPRILNISGGEPALVKELPALLSKAKEVWNPFIRVVHNGSGPERLAPSFPYIDRLVISADGPDEVNAATRGLPGGAVLEKIAGIKSPAAPEIVINTVVTESNIAALPLFAAQINSISPDILLALLPVMPVSSGLSVLRDGREAGYRRFLDVYAEIKAAHSLTVHNFDCVVRHEDLRKIQCYNQYFTVRFSPAGEFFACGAGLSSQFRRTDGVFRKIFRKGGVKKAFTMLARAISAKTGRPDFTCRNICNCDSWLDMLFLNMDTQYAAPAMRGLGGRLTEADYAELDGFVRAYINPEFDLGRFRAIIAG